MGVSPACEHSYDVNHKSGGGWGAFPESAVAQGSVMRSCLHYQSAAGVLATYGGIGVMASEQDCSQPLTFWQQLVSQVKL